MRYRILTVTALAAVVSAGGCGEATGPLEGKRQLGVLQYEGLGALSGSVRQDPRSPIRWSIQPGDGVAYVPNAIDAPDTVPAGVGFTVSVHTVGPNGCWRAAGMDMGRESRTIEFKPWDVHSGADLCTEILGILRHDAGLTLTEKGEWTLRATGRLVRQGEAPELPITAERTIVVR